LNIGVEDRWDVLNTVKFWMTEPGVELDGLSRPVGKPLKLCQRPAASGQRPAASGQRLWLAAGSEPSAWAAIIQPMLPAMHDVSAPGLLLRGVHLK
jgi:hypothetical protein